MVCWAWASVLGTCCGVLGMGRDVLGMGRSVDWGCCVRLTHKIGKLFKLHFFISLAIFVGMPLLNRVVNPLPRLSVITSVMRQSRTGSPCLEQVLRSASSSMPYRRKGISGLQKFNSQISAVGTKQF